MNNFKQLGLVFSLLLASFSFTAIAQPFFIHVQGDSNSEGMLPGPFCEWNDKICAAKNTERPWPLVLQRTLQAQGLQVIVLNHAESGRQLIEFTKFENAINGVGRKDGRVSLQQIIMTMMNNGGERNADNFLLINLGTNDLQIKDITEAQLKGRLITHIVTILTNPTLQFNLLARLDHQDRDAADRFMMTLNRLTAQELAQGETTTELADLINENQALIRKLFALIGWRILIIPPVLVTGHPFGQFPSGHLAARWAAIVEDVVNFFATPNLMTVENAQAFAVPHVDEWGGMVHFDAADHQAFGERMAQFMLPLLRADIAEVLVNEEIEEDAIVRGMVQTFSGLH